MKYKVGDKVRIKGVEWYGENKNINGDVPLFSIWFTREMSNYLGTTHTIISVMDGSYVVSDVDYVFTDDMISGFASDTTLFPSRIYSPLASITIQELALIIPHLIAGTIPGEEEVISRHWKTLN